MNNEYVIINKTALEKRVAELKKELKQFEKYQSISREPILTQIEVLKQLLSQSTPLIPEIEKAFDKGVCAIQENNGKLKVKMPKAKQDYISNLKFV